MSELAMFRADGDALVPTQMAQSLWSADQMHGVATSGALARVLELRLAEMGRTELRPARYTLDLFKPARMAPGTTRVEVVREGSRIVLMDAFLEQEHGVVARASAVCLLPTDAAPDKVWSADEHPEPPPLALAPVSTEPRVPFFRSEAGWSQDFGQHQNASRKATWQTGIPVVAGEETTPFQAVASIADATSMVVNWGASGVEYINTDVTLAISRLPESVEIGLEARDRVVADGIAIGTATVFDRRGPLGTTVISAISNSRRAIDFTQHDFTEGPGA